MQRKIKPLIILYGTQQRYHNKTPPSIECKKKPINNIRQLIYIYIYIYIYTHLPKVYNS